MILRFLFFIQTFLKYCKALSIETYKRYINILLLLLFTKNLFVISRARYFENLHLTNFRNTTKMFVILK